MKIMDIVGWDTHTHYDAHAFALIGERENLQDCEVQDLSTRGPQLHWRLISANQGQTHTLCPLNQRHLERARKRETEILNFTFLRLLNFINKCSQKTGRNWCGLIFQCRKIITQACHKQVSRLESTNKLRITKFVLHLPPFPVKCLGCAVRKIQACNAPAIIIASLLGTREDKGKPHAIH